LKKKEQEEEKKIVSLQPRAVKRKLPAGLSCLPKKLKLNEDSQQSIPPYQNSTYFSDVPPYIAQYPTESNCYSATYDTVSQNENLSSDTNYSEYLYSDTNYSESYEYTQNQRETERYLEQMRERGWIQNEDGQFYKDPNVDWDSDEEEPPKPPHCLSIHVDKTDQTDT